MNAAKRLSCLLLAAALLFSGALAEFSPRLNDILEAYDAGTAYQTDISVQSAETNGLSQSSLAVVNDWLKSLSFRMTQQSSLSGVLSKGEMIFDGETLFAADMLEKDSYTLTVFSPSEGAYLTAPGKPDALSLLLGDDAISIPQISPLDMINAWLGGLSQMYIQMSEVGKMTKATENTSIKNVGTAPKREIYSFTADQMNALWPDLTSLLLPGFEAALGGIDGAYAEAGDFLNALEFSGSCRVRRFLTKAGEDMGFEFTGNAAIGEDKRKVTIFGGYTADKGIYLSLSAPATKGKNNFKLVVSGALVQKDTQNTLELTLDMTRTLEGKTTTFGLTASLKNAKKDGSETWSGKVTINQKDAKGKMQYTLTPAITLDNTGMNGAVTVLVKKDDKQTFKGAITLAVAEADTASEQPAINKAQDLRSLTAAQATTVVSGELSSLYQAFFRMMEGLDEDTRTLLTHELAGAAWTEGAAVPAEGASANDNAFTVKEDEQ